MSHTERVIILVDMDCFYCQVEENLNPTLKGKPVAVVQYNQWQGGGIIAVNYEARGRGVTRHMRGKEAKAKCPEIKLVQVPSIRGKADTSKYREAGKSVAKVLLKFTSLLERASVDEAYLDVTQLAKSRMETASHDISIGQLQNTFTIGGSTRDFLYNVYSSGMPSESNLKLLWGGVIAEEIRAAVYKETGYTCSAGISHNKILAKLSCGLNKPNKQTILSLDHVEELYKNLPVQKIRGLGAKFGNSLSEDLGITYMGELVKFGERELAKRYDDKTGSWLYNIARGIDTEPVTTRLVANSISCCKNFRGKAALKTAEDITHWLNELALEIVERLEQDYEENSRKAKNLTISFGHIVNGSNLSGTRVIPLGLYDTKKITNDAFEVIKKNCYIKKDGTFFINYLGIGASKFENQKNVNEITSFFKVQNEPTPIGNSKIHSKVITKNPVVCSNDSNVEDESDTTIDLQEDSSGLKFFEENNSDQDSITEELPEKTSNKPTESFFLRYFERLKKLQSPPLQRDFNTSRILNEAEVETEESEPEIPSTSGLQNQEVYACDKCNTVVSEMERTSHADFHFAMDLVQSETAEMVKREPRVSQKPISSKKEVKKAGKRKSVEMEKNTTFTSFFKTENDSEKTEVCSECNKKFHYHELASHLDYHAAKRLHLEINKIQTPPIQIGKSISVVKTTTKSKTKGVRSVKSFFKSETNQKL